MAYKYREDLVGKRFLAVSGVTKINVNKVSEWGWKAGVIRAASLKDNKNKELQVMLNNIYAIFECLILISYWFNSYSFVYFSKNRVISLRTYARLDGLPTRKKKYKSRGTTNISNS